MVDDIFTPVAYLDNPGSDTQAWVHVSRELREVVVAFRGTEQVKWKDLAADINLIPTSLDEERTGNQDLGLGIPLPFATFRKSGWQQQAREGAVVTDWVLDEAAGLWGSARRGSLLAGDRTTLHKAA